MPLESAKKVLSNSNATIEELYNSIMSLSRQAGDLGCRSNKNSELLEDLAEIEEIINQLQERYETKIRG